MVAAWLLLIMRKLVMAVTNLPSDIYALCLKMDACLLPMWEKTVATARLLVKLLAIAAVKAWKGFYALCEWHYYICELIWSKTVEGALWLWAFTKTVPTLVSLYVLVPLATSVKAISAAFEAAVQAVVFEMQVQRRALKAAAETYRKAHAAAMKP